MERRHRPSTPHLSLHPLTDVFDNPSYSDGFVASFPVVSELLYSDPKWVLFGSYLYGSRYKKSRESWRNFKNAAIFRRLVVVEKCSSPLVHTCSRTGALYIYWIPKFIRKTNRGKLPLEGAVSCELLHCRSNNKLSELINYFTTNFSCADSTV